MSSISALDGGGALVDAALPSVGQVPAPVEPSSTEDQRLALVEETVRLDKRVIETGKVLVHSIVDEEPIVLRGQLEQTSVRIIHIPIERVVDSVPAERIVDGVQILSIVEERFRLVRELVLVEEVHISRVVSSEAFETTATRRKMRAVVERNPIPSQPLETR